MTGPFSFDELAARLKVAAEAELFAINQLELLASKASTAAGDHPELHRLTVGETRRQAEALAFASQVMKHFAACPGFTFAMPQPGLSQ